MHSVQGNHLIKFPTGRRVTGSDRWGKLFKLNIIRRKTFPRLSNQEDKIILKADQFAKCLALDETPECCLGDDSTLHGWMDGTLYLNTAFYQIKIIQQ